MCDVTGLEYAANYRAGHFDYSCALKNLPHIQLARAWLLRYN